MAVLRLTPSTYYLSNTSYLSISNASNMYNNTNNTTYATVTNSRKSTTSYYIYIRGFNFDDIPSNAIINSWTVKFKARESGVSTSTSYRPYLANGTSTITGSCNTIGTSVTTYEFTGVSADLDTIIGYGSNFGIRINCRRASRNTTSYMYIYGAEIEIDYTLPVYHTVTSSTTDGTISPFGSTTLLEGEDYTLVISGITPTVTDNGIDVTNQLTQSSEVITTSVPYSYTNDTFTVSDISNAYTDASSETYASLDLEANSGTTGYIYLDLESINIPTGATIINVSCQATLEYYRNGSSSNFVASCQMYSGNTAKGSSTDIVTTGSSDVSKTTFNLSVGSWTADELTNARFYLTATNSAYGTHRFIYIYGISLNVTYESDGITYIYTLTNVTADHVIIVSLAETNTLYIKVNGNWISVDSVYIKQNGTWVKQNDITSVFSTSQKYIKGN